MSSTRLLDFFVLEASDYVERLDGLLAEADGRPDTDAFTAQARLLRGSATMARQLPIADLSSALERIGRAVRDGIVDWNPELQGALTAAVDDLKILIRAVRSWGPGDDHRTEARISELVSLYPQATKTRPTPPINPRNSSFIASESAQLASALDSLVAHPSAPDALALAAHRLNSLRGVAAINDTPPLAQVLGALDDLLRPINARGEGLETQHLAVLMAGVKLMRRFSQEIAIGGAIDASSPTIQEFSEALTGLSRGEANGQDVIPISRLNFEDGLPQLVSASAQPPSSPAVRFRLEAAGPSEHLRHQVALARAANNDLTRRRAGDEMRASLRVLRSIAEGFEENEVLAFVNKVVPGLEDLNLRSLDLLDELAKALLDDTSDKRLAFARLEALLGSRPPTPTSSHSFASDGLVDLSSRPAAPAPRAAPQVQVQVQAPAAASAPTAAPAAAPPAQQPAPMSGAGLSAMLASGIEVMAGLDDEPFSQPAQIAEENLIPITELLYTGRAALQRAQEIRDAIRARAGDPYTDELDEIFELLDLAAVE